jgi:hypothetical protein
MTCAFGVFAVFLQVFWVVSLIIIIIIGGYVKISRKKGKNCLFSEWASWGKLCQSSPHCSERTSVEFASLKIIKNKKTQLRAKKNILNLYIFKKKLPKRKFIDFYYWGLFTSLTALTVTFISPQLIISTQVLRCKVWRIALSPCRCTLFLLVIQVTDKKIGIY